MGLASILFILIIGIALFPFLTKVIGDLRKSQSEKERDAEKESADQERREDEGLVITTGRVLFGDELFDQIKKNRPVTNIEGIGTVTVGDLEKEAEQVEAFQKKSKKQLENAKTTKEDIEDLKKDIEQATQGTLTLQNGKVIDKKTGKQVKTTGLLQSLSNPEKNSLELIQTKNKQQKQKKRRSVFG